MLRKAPGNDWHTGAVVILIPYQKGKQNNQEAACNNPEVRIGQIFLIKRLPHVQRNAE